MKYKKEYWNIGFRVIFEIAPHVKNTLTFAAHPYEQMMDTELNSKPDAFLVQGRVVAGEKLEVGFRAFTMEMTPDFHRRLGELYEVVKTEYRNTIFKKV
ncbi:hypothetical protein MTsPCn5_16980 [Croceitalea sp. MTPC5]|uniref:Uncharacterized protein n=1 Tax=Croceitalea marina TaxID=1775166 RepID=A0ABW5MW39_9FLAO|nr:hypothetical protein MTsPCn5_16980 [Croceitalea sp. MTPC5]